MEFVGWSWEWPVGPRPARSLACRTAHVCSSWEGDCIRSRVCDAGTAGRDPGLFPSSRGVVSYRFACATYVLAWSMDLTPADSRDAAPSETASLAASPDERCCEVSNDSGAAVKASSGRVGGLTLFRFGGKVSGGPLDDVVSPPDTPVPCRNDDRRLSDARWKLVVTIAEKGDVSLGDSSSFVSSRLELVEESRAPRGSRNHPRIWITSEGPGPASRGEIVSASLLFCRVSFSC